MYHQQRQEEIKQRLPQIRDLANKTNHKRLKKLANEMPQRKLLRLDYGDISLVHSMLRNVYFDLHNPDLVETAYQTLWRVFLIATSGCSQLIELLEYEGADMQPPA